MLESPMVYSFHMANQQERSKIESWIVGFTDGEGCFSVSIFRNQTARLGWQVFPVFVITQGKKSLPALETFERYFGWGKIFVNKRYDNHREHIYRYCIRNISELGDVIVPFFRKNKLRTAKQEDFEMFARIVEMMLKNQHLSLKGMQIIARKIEKMNRKVPSQFLKSSETTRRAPVKNRMKI